MLSEASKVNDSLSLKKSASKGEKVLKKSTNKRISSERSNIAILIDGELVASEAEAEEIESLYNGINSRSYKDDKEPI